MFESTLERYKVGKAFRALDLFAGCGGLSYGLDLAGIDVVAANEFWADAASTHRLNHKQTEMIEGDVTSADIKNEIVKVAGRVDLLAGGPPCQAYSDGKCKRSPYNEA